MKRPPIQNCGEVGETMLSMRTAFWPFPPSPTASPASVCWSRRPGSPETSAGPRWRRWPGGPRGARTPPRRRTRSSGRQTLCTGWCCRCSSLSAGRVSRREYYRRPNFAQAVPESWMTPLKRDSQKAVEVDELLEVEVLLEVDVLLDRLSKWGGGLNRVGNKCLPTLSRWSSMWSWVRQGTEWVGRGFATQHPNSPALRCGGGG